MTTFLTCIGAELFFTEQPKDIPGPNCACADSVSKVLTESYGAKLGSWRVSNAPSPVLYVRKMGFDSSVIPPNVIPQFCPFCGVKYGDEQTVVSAGDPSLADRVERVEARIATLEGAALRTQASAA